jgi:hypothetical protein
VVVAAVAAAISWSALRRRGCLRLDLQQPIYRPLGFSDCLFPCRAGRDLFAPIGLWLMRMRRVDGGVPSRRTVHDAQW